MCNKKDVATELSNSQSASKEEKKLPGELKLTLTFVDKSPRGQYLSLYCTEFTDRLQELSFESGKVGDKLEEIVDFRDALKPGHSNLLIRIDESSGFESLGLCCQYESGRLIISGVPKFEFNVNVVVKSRRAVLVSNKEEYCREFTVTRRLNVCSPQDSRALWEKHAPPQDAPYWAPNKEKRAFVIHLDTPITILAASRRGRSHEHVGAFRDDYFTLKPAADLYGWHVFAVADGAGSARFSREGAKLACETLTKELSERLNEPQMFEAINDAVLNEIKQAHRNGVLPTDFLQDSDVLEKTKLYATFHQAVYQAYEAINQEAKSFNASCGTSDKKVSMRDFNTTTLCVAMRRFQGQPGFLRDDKKYRPPIWAIVSYWVGDGASAIYRPNDRDEVLLLGQPDGGEFAGQTQFLTTTAEIAKEPILKRLRLAFVRKFRGIVMATDGISDPFFPSDSSLKKFEYWRKFWTETLPENFPGVLDKSKTPGERAEALLKGMEFWVKGNHDDRTMALILNDRLED